MLTLLTIYMTGLVIFAIMGLAMTIACVADLSIGEMILMTLFWPATLTIIVAILVYDYACYRAITKD